MRAAIHARFLLVTLCYLFNMRELVRPLHRRSAGSLQMALAGAKRSADGHPFLECSAMFEQRRHVD
jgi:hypothetical protein